MIYLNANGRLDDALSEVTVHGGKIVQSKHAIGPFWIRAIILDTEGNRVALHSDLSTNAAPRMYYEHPVQAAHDYLFCLLAVFCYAVLMPALKPVATRVSCS